MTSEYTGKNEKGIIKKFIRTVTTTCPTTDCHETHLSVKTLQQDGDESERNHITTHDRDHDHSESTKREGIFKVVGNNGNNIKESSESYLDDALSELAKKQLAGGSNENVFCTSSGCYNSLKELQEIQLLAETINGLQSKLRDNSKVEQMLTRMREEISSDIKKTLDSSTNQPNGDHVISQTSHAERTKPHFQSDSSETGSRKP